MRTNKTTLLTILLLVGILLISFFVVLVTLTRTSTPHEGDVAIGKATPSGTTIEFPELKDGEILAGNRWPDACSFVSQQEIKSIFPGVKDIEQEHHWIHLMSIKDFAADPSWKEGDHSESGQCLYSMRLPGEIYRATQFWLRIQGVADPS